MNKKGTIFLGLVVALIVFISGALLISPLQDNVTETRTDLSCADVDNISDGTKIMCLLTDALVPYYIIAFISIAAGFVVEFLR